MTAPVTVRVAADVPPEDLDQLLGDLRAIGLNPQLRPVATRRGVSDLPWLVLLALPMKLFFETLMQQLAGDAYLRLKTIAARVLHGQHGSEDNRRVLVLEDTTTGLLVMLEPDLPPEAYQRLFHTDLSAFARGPLHYDRSRQQWRSELDEWERQSHFPHDHSLDGPRRA